MFDKENCLDEAELIENEENTEELESVDERFIEVELIKEMNRIDREIVLNMDECDKHPVFKKGNNDALYYSGYFTTLINVGMPLDKAYELTLNAQTGKINVDIENIKLEEVKAQNIQVQNQML